MPIILARIDDRLIHGQITVAWSRISNPDIIAVVSDAVASDEIQRSALQLATPLGVDLAVYSVKEAIRELAPGSSNAKKRSFVIAPNPKEFLKLAQQGVQISSINVGQMGFKKGKKQISKTLSVDKQDVEAFRRLLLMGIELEHRQLPGNKKVDVGRLLMQAPLQEWR